VSAKTKHGAEILKAGKWHDEDLKPRLVNNMHMRYWHDELSTPVTYTR
jgi:hypothetical protein